MKTIGNHKWMILGAVLLALALVLPMAGSAVAATGDTKVNIPAEVVGVDNTYGPVVYFRQGSTDIGPFKNGDIAPLNAGIYSWKFRVNGYTTPLRTGFNANGSNELNVTAADYCKRKVIIPGDMKNLDTSSAYITDRWLPGTFKFFNNDSYYLPMGSTNAYWLIINGMGTLHNIAVDCTPLKAGEMIVSSYCEMKIIVPQALKDIGATVGIYGISQGHAGTYPWFTGGETVVLPIGQTITWYLKINGFEVAHTGKAVDCTPINVTAADYCTVVNNTGKIINIYNTITLDIGASVVLPMGANIEWKYAAGQGLTPQTWPGIKKTVDCTPITAPVVP